MTGANSGLGFEVARRLAGHGADTILLCRSREGGEAAVRQIEKESPAASVELAICDLSSLSSIRAFVDDLARRHPKLDLLYNNAAVMKPNRTTTGDGFETMFQVNYLAAFVLMTSLLDLLRQGTSPLIINSASPPGKLRLVAEPGSESERGLDRLADWAATHDPTRSEDPRRDRA